MHFVRQVKLDRAFNSPPDPRRSTTWRIPWAFPTCAGSPGRTSRASVSCRRARSSVDGPGDVRAHQVAVRWCGLVETINHRTGGASTESTVLGPFHMVASPPQELGANIALDGKGAPCLVSGQMTGPDGEPVAGAEVDVWQANEDGFHDVLQPDVQPAGNLCGLFTADADGRYWFRSVVPR
jgi:hypothetical protein